MVKKLRRVISFLVSLSLIIGNLFVNNIYDVKAADELLPLPFSIEDTEYGVLDSDVIAKKIHITDEDAEILGVDYDTNTEYAGQGYLFVRKKIDNFNSLFYLVDTHGCVKEYKAPSDWHPSIGRHSLSNAKNIVYSIQDPSTKKWDIYNATNGEFYNYQIEGTLYGFNGYGKEIIMVKKDNLYGLMGEDGKLLYDIKYEDITERENCFLGYTENGYAVLTRDGKTSGSRMYTDIYGTGGDLVCVENSEGKMAVLSLKTGDLVTEYKYCSLMNYNTDQIIEYDNKGYVIAEYHDANNKWITDIISSEKTITLNDKLNRENVRYYGRNIEKQGIFAIYASNGESAWNSDEFACYVDINGDKVGSDYYFDSDDGKNQINYTYGYCDGYLIRNEFSSLSSGRHTNYYWVDSSGKTVLEDVGKPQAIINNYIIAEREKGYVIFDSKKREIILDNILPGTLDNFLVTMEDDITFIMIGDATDKTNKYGLFNAKTGKFSGFCYESNGESATILAEYNVEDKGICIVDDGSERYKIVNDKLEIINDNLITETSDYIVDGNLNLVKVGNAGFINEGEKIVTIVDYNGKVQKFDTRYDYTRGNSIILNDEQKSVFITQEDGRCGLISSGGELILKNEYDEMVGADSFTYVSSDNVSAVVDEDGKALIYGEYDSTIEPEWSFFGEYVNYGESISFEKDGEYYLYNYERCSGTYSDDSEYITEDQLFGEYSSYLRNNSYEYMCGMLRDDISEIVWSRSGVDNALSAMKSNFSGGLTYSVKSIYELITGNEVLEQDIEEEVALEYLKDVSNDIMEEIISDAKTTNNLVKKISETAGYGLNALETLTEQKQFAEIWENSSFDKEGISKLIKEIKSNKKQIDNQLKVVGRVISVAEIAETLITISLVENELVIRLMKLLPQDSTLYKGLQRINKKQRSNGLVTLVKEMLEKETFSKIGKFMEKGLEKIICNSGKILSADLVSIVGMGYYIIGSVMTVPKMESVDKAVISVVNQGILKNAVDEEIIKIKNNYESGGKIEVDTLKAEYELLYNTYLQSIISGVDYASDIATEVQLSKLNRHYSDYDGKLIYRSYINSCLINANSDIEYEVDSNSAKISKINLKKASGNGRISLEYLIQSSASINYSNSGVNVEYSIDIPGEIDGYKVETISQNVLNGNSDVYCVYIPDTVKNIQSLAFENCTNIDTVILENQVETIGDYAFSNCTNLSEIRIPFSVQDISDNAFENTEDFHIVTEKNTIAEEYAKNHNIHTEDTEKAIASISIKHQPEKKVFDINEELDSTGLVLEISYVDGTKSEVTNGYYCYTDNKKVGENVVKVNYGGFEDEYFIDVTPSECVYTISYQDEYGNVIADNIVESAMAGEKLKVPIPEINGYIPVNNSMEEVIKEYNYFIVEYTSVPKKDINEAEIEYEDFWIYTGEQIRPNVKVTYDGTELRKDKDYSVEYDENLEGDGLIEICGIGEFNGIVWKSIFINKPVSYPEVIEVKDLNKFESRHPYSDNEDRTWVYTDEKAKSITVQFSTSTFVEDSCDYIYIYDVNDNEVGYFTGDELAGKTIKVDGNSIKIRLITDESINEYGFKVVNINGKEIGKDSTETQTTTVNVKEKTTTSVVNKQKTKVSVVKSPKASKIKSIKKAKKSLKISWKKIKGVSGYQIQYSTSRKFKKAKKITIKKAKITSKTIKKLKAKKKYYVRIRTYIVVNGEKKYSSWSKKKSQKTK